MHMWELFDFFNYPLSTTIESRGSFIEFTKLKKSICQFNLRNSENLSLTRYYPLEKKKSVSQTLKRNQFFCVHWSDYFMADVDFADGKESILYKDKNG